MSEDAGAILARAHQSLAEGAAVSKRAAAAHKRALRNQKQAMEQIEAYAKRHGIELIVEPNDTAQGGHSR
jgi:predicted Zn-ribbon and HTH transcriptional regulator